MPTRSRAAFAIGVLLTFAYVAAFGWVASQVTFYWDDYFLLLTLADRGLLGAMFTGINGNWWPVATPLLALEAKAFGLWYPGYIMVNAVLLAASAWLLAALARALAPGRVWSPLVIGVVFATSLGVVVNGTVITASWPLSVALALGAALAWIRKSPAWVWSGLLLLSLLSESGLAASNAAAVAALVLVSRLLEAPGGLKVPAWRMVLGPLVVAFLGTLALLAGYVIATREPIDYYARVAVSETTSQGLPVSIPPILDLMTSSLSFSLAWLASPVLPTALLRPAVLPWLVILVQTYWLAIVCCLTLATAGLVWWWVRRTSLRVGLILIPLVLAAPVLQLSLILAVTRTGSGFAPRYWILWLVPVLSLWAITLHARATTRWLRIASTGGVLLLCASGVLGIILFPQTLRSAIDVDKQRWTNSPAQRAAIEDCLDVGAARSSDQVGPGLNDRDFCRAVVWTDSL